MWGKPNVVVWGSAPLTRKLQLSPMMGQKEGHAAERALQRGVHARGRRPNPLARRKPILDRRNLGIRVCPIHRWRRDVETGGNKAFPGNNVVRNRELLTLMLELARMKKAFFVRESSQSTRRSDATAASTRFACVVAWRSRPAGPLTGRRVHPVPAIKTTPGCL